MRQVHALEHEVNGRERLHGDPAGAQFSLDLEERDAGLGVHQGSQQILMRLEHRTTMAANSVWLRGAGLAQPPHELQGRGGAHFVTSGSLTDRAALLNGTHNAPAQVLRNGVVMASRDAHAPPPPSSQTSRFRSTPNRSSQLRSRLRRDIAIAVQVSAERMPTRGVR